MLFLPESPRTLHRLRGSRPHSRLRRSPSPTLRLWHADILRVEGHDNRAADASSPNWERAFGVSVAGSASDRDAYDGRVRVWTFVSVLRRSVSTLPPSPSPSLPKLAKGLAKAKSPLPIGR